MEVFLTKGMRVRAEWFDTHVAGLPGAQIKFGATKRLVEGVVTHVRGDHPTHPTEVRVWVKRDEGDEVVVKPEWIVAVFGEEVGSRS